jgi:hypothetical protein
MRLAVLASLGFAVLAACSGGGGTAPSEPSPACGGTVVDTQAKLVSPAPGATGVSPSIGAITFTYGNPATPTASFTLFPSDGSAAVAANVTGTVTIVPGQWTLLIPALKPATTYRVSGATFDYAHLVCYTTVAADLGSFTTR